MPYISSYQDPTTQISTIMISTINYRETISEHTNLTKIIGIPPYDTLHLLQNKIKSNATAVHRNLGSDQHGYLGLVLRTNAYIFLSKNTFVRPVHPGTLVIPQFQPAMLKMNSNAITKKIDKYFMKRKE